MLYSSRRTLIRLLAYAATWLPASALAAIPLGPPGRGNSITALGPFLDVLLPPDSVSPGATQLGVDRAITARFRRNPRLGNLVTLGCGWLDQQARVAGGADFATLAPLQQESIVAAAAASASPSLPLVFFNTLRDLAWLHYYTQAESWAGLHYAGPPQPVGFPGHDQAPAEVGG